MISKIKLIILFVIFFPIKTYSLIEVDITRGNLNPLPIAISPLFSENTSEIELSKETNVENIGEKIALVVENNLSCFARFKTSRTPKFYKLFPSKFARHIINSYGLNFTLIF